MKRMNCIMTFVFDFVVDDYYDIDDVGKMLYKDFTKYVDVGLWGVGITKYKGDIKVGYNPKNQKYDKSIQKILMKDKKEVC